ncbi:MAG: hypothetical protein Q9224_006344, partial [Gallowayella concinna]
MISFRSNNADHKRIRTVLNRAFSEKVLAAQEPLLQEHVALLIQKLRDHTLGPTANPIDLAQWLNFITFDVVGDLGFGESFHCVENGQYHEWVGNVIGYMKMRTILRVAGYFSFLKGLLLAMTPRNLKKKRMQMSRWAIDRVDKRMAMKTQRPDFYTPLLNQTDEKRLSKTELRETGLFLILAGSETTASVLAGVMFLLGTHPDVLNRLTTEIRGTYLEEKQITIASLSVNETLNAVLDESLRLFPA